MVGPPCDHFFQTILIKRKLKGNFVILGVLMAKINGMIQIDCNQNSEVQIEKF
jgi:hypothetical protein